MGQHPEATRLITTRLLTPEPGRLAAEAWVSEHLGHLVCDEVRGSRRFHGGQRAADAALAAFDVEGYARFRNEVWPDERRGASALSPYIRHGLLGLAEVWEYVTDGPSYDVEKFRSELMWQEYSRVVYARVGRRSSTGYRRELPTADGSARWDRSMLCVGTCVDELETDGWLVNQTRMWLASDWSVRNGARWQDGEDEFFRHLLDGSRAANRLGWQWTTGVGSSKHYGFSRWQVDKRAPGLCDQCPHAADCPIEDWPADPEFTSVETPSELGRVDSLPVAVGPAKVESRSDPEVVWLTAESVGVHDPALRENPQLPVIFVFDEPLLAQLQLSSKRLVFLVETLAELGEQRDVNVHVGRAPDVLSGRKVAVTHAPVPGFANQTSSGSSSVDVAELHPWPWLAEPTTRSIRSFSAWRKSAALR